MNLMSTRTAHIILLMVLLLPFPFEINQLSAQTNNALPVLRVSFDGKFKKGMTEYLNGKMQLTDVDGSVVELPAMFKTRGATAASYMMKPSFNMKLKSDDYTEEVDSTLLDLRSCSSWILDAMAIDRICMRNRVCFDTWNEFSRLPYETQFDGRYGTIGRFVEVYINDKYYAKAAASFMTTATADMNFQKKTWLRTKSTDARKFQCITTLQKFMTTSGRSAKTLIPKTSSISGTTTKTNLSTSSATS